MQSKLAIYIYWRPSIWQFVFENPQYLTVSSHKYKRSKCKSISMGCPNCFYWLWKSVLMRLLGPKFPPTASHLMSSVHGQPKASYLGPKYRSGLRASGHCLRSACVRARPHGQPLPPSSSLSHNSHFPNPLAAGAGTGFWQWVFKVKKNLKHEGICKLVLSPFHINCCLFTKYILKFGEWYSKWWEN
jgi:hypothetical protein